jgi:tol-pal system protein YbgF
MIAGGAPRPHRRSFVTRFARLLPASVMMLTLVGIASPARAANKDMERLQVQVAFLQGQITDLKRAVDDAVSELHRLNESLADQSTSLKRTTQDRRSQDEATQTALRELTERVAELADRMQSLQSSTATSSAPPPVASAAPALPGPPANVGPVSAAPSPMAPRELYSQAYADYARGNFDLAIQEYQEYLRTYPSTDLSDNAQYWIGECHYAKARFEEAIEDWNTLLREYPASDKLPDARFKKGMALERLGRRSQALIEYRYVMDRFPNSDAGRRAREKLNP